MNKSKKNNSNISTWIFVFLSCAFIVTIGYKNNNDNSLSEIHDKTNANEELITESNDDNNRNDSILEEEIDKSNNENQDSISEIINSNDKITLNEQSIIKKDIFVNKIVIAKNIDNDKNSDTYRNPIDAFKTITTLDDNVIKEVNYYPYFFIWSSINTENASLIKKEGFFEPINLSMTIKCKNELIEKNNYNITATTPRWREWIKIDATNIKDEMLNELWNIEITDNTNGEILESRNFKFILDNQIANKNEEQNSLLESP